LTINKAIEILQLDKKGENEVNPADLEMARQIGIEGLQRINEIRGCNTLMGIAISEPGRLLPSEDQQ